MYSPRASSRRSRRDVGTKSQKRSSSIVSKPDSPIKENPKRHIERPLLPAPINLHMHNFSNPGSFTSRPSEQSKTGSRVVINPETQSTHHSVNTSRVDTNHNKHNINSTTVRIVKNNLMPSHKLVKEEYKTHHQSMKSVSSLTSFPKGKLKPPSLLSPPSHHSPKPNSNNQS